MLTREEGKPQDSQAPENSSYCDRLVRYTLNSQNPEKSELPFTISASVIDIQFTAQNHSRTAHCHGEGLETDGNANPGAAGGSGCWVGCRAARGWPGRGGRQWGDTGEVGRTRQLPTAATESLLRFQHSRVHRQLQRSRRNLPAGA